MNAVVNGQNHPVGRVSPPGGSVPKLNDVSPAHRLRRLHRVWPDCDGNISYLLTVCVEGRGQVLDNDEIFQRLVGFLIASPQHYSWFGRRFVIMPDHVHLIAHMGRNAIRLGQWIKTLKAVVGGLQNRAANEGRISTSSDSNPTFPPGAHDYTRVKRNWRWQASFHDHKFRTRESESRKWEYICMNPVRYRLVERPEQWPYGGEIFFNEKGGPVLVRGTPPLMETGILVEEKSQG